MAVEASRVALLKLECAEKSPGVLLNADSDSGGLGWDLKFCISNKLPGDGDAVDPQTSSEQGGPKEPILFLFNSSLREEELRDEEKCVCVGIGLLRLDQFYASQCSPLALMNNENIFESLWSSGLLTVISIYYGYPDPYCYCNLSLQMRHREVKSFV